MKLSLLFSRNPRLPRLLVTRALALSFALSGCVPSTSYEQANSAAEVEREGHRRSAEKLAAAEAALAAEKAEKESLLAQKKALEEKLLTEEERLARTSLEMETASKAQEEQSELVTQLRGELARVGEHIKVYRDDKEELSAQLSAAEARVSMLEGQVALLKNQEKDTLDANKQLEDALVDLQELQKDVGQDPATDEAPEPEGTESDSAADEPAPSDESAPSDEEVMPTEEEAPAEDEQSDEEAP